ncbi:hypothetical protein SteCoe_11775 [Stentor coeruleus]|uniref:Uncharacterized protein n=1 Tax=Stentor coeruleus TaxID=5963 RepID=A0A1R2CCF4_9CILI|nr:hypothetical protein SteCoe_11775 [Stentor coeruleus]
MLSAHLRLSKNQQNFKQSLTSLSEYTSPKNHSVSLSFYDEVETMMKEVDPNFELFIGDKAPMAQIIDSLKQAISSINSHKNNFLNDSNDFSIEYSDYPVCKNCGKVSKNIINALEKVKKDNEKVKKKLKRFEKLKFIQNEKIKEEKDLLKKTKDRLESLAQKLTDNKTVIITEHKENKKVKFIMENNKIINCWASGKMPVKKISNLVMQSYSIFHIDNSMDFTSLIEEMDSQINVYNNEISKREEFLNEKEIRLGVKEIWINKELNNLEMINLSLSNSKNEFLELKHEIFPALEYQSELLKQLIQDLTDKKQEIEEYLKSLKNQSIDKGMFSNIIYAQSEVEKKYKENLEYADYLVNLQKKLDKYYEDKNKEIKESGEKLARLQENVNHTIELITKKEKELITIGLALKEKEKTLNGLSSRNTTIMQNCNSQDSDRFKTAHIKNRKSMYSFANNDVDDKE